MTKTQQARIKNLHEMRKIDRMVYHTAYGALFHPTNMPIPKPPYKDYYVCMSCEYAASRTCYKYERCTGCPQYSRRGKRTKTTDTHCLCNTVEYREACKYYKPYRFGKENFIIMEDEL